MDLHLTKDQPTSAEKAAVDGVLGPPESGWDGGHRRAEVDGRSAFITAKRRDLLLPVLHAIQSRVGWISPGALNYVALRMNRSVPSVKNLWTRALALLRRSLGEAP